MFDIANPFADAPPPPPAPATPKRVKLSPAGKQALKDGIVTPELLAHAEATPNRMTIAENAKMVATAIHEQLLPLREQIAELQKALAVEQNRAVAGLEGEVDRFLGGQ